MSRRLLLSVSCALTVGCGGVPVVTSGDDGAFDVCRDHDGARLACEEDDACQWVEMTSKDPETCETLARRDACVSRGETLEPGDQGAWFARSRDGAVLMIHDTDECFELDGVPLGYEACVGDPLYDPPECGCVCAGVERCPWLVDRQAMDACALAAPCPIIEKDLLGLWPDEATFECLFSHFASNERFVQVMHEYWVGAVASAWVYRIEDDEALVINSIDIVPRWVSGEDGGWSGCDSPPEVVVLRCGLKPKSYYLECAVDQDLDCDELYEWFDGCVETGPMCR